MCNLLTKLDNNNEARAKQKQPKQNNQANAKIEHRHISVCSISFAPCLFLWLAVVALSPSSCDIQCTQLYATCLKWNEQASESKRERKSDKNSDIFCKLMCDWRNKLYFKSALNRFQAFNSAHSRKHGTFSTSHIFPHSHIDSRS